jgi:transcriptional regulator with XRE-family HTH domain
MHLSLRPDASQEPASYPGPEDTYGDRLRWARKRSHRSQLDLAQAARCSQSNVSKLEREDVIGSIWTVHFARECRVDPWWLATGEGSPARGLR